jgi:hypothetical protein
MARLRQVEQERRIELRASTLVGRSFRCDLKLEPGEVSGQHAELRYKGGAWTLRDLGSRNGVFVNGQRLGPDEAASLKVGMTLAFGHVRNAWLVEDLGPPPIEAVPVDGGRAIPAIGQVLLIEFDGESLSVCQGSRGWMVQAGEGARPVKDQDQIEVGGRRYVLHLPG